MKINIDEKQWLAVLPEPRAWEEDRLRDIKFLDRVNDDDDEDLAGTEGKEGGGDFVREYNLDVGKREGGGGGTNIPITSTKEPQARYKESTTTKLTPNEKQLSQEDYEGMGEYYVGRHVDRDFKGVSFRGVVTNWDVDSRSGGEIWEVTYEDGDIEDLFHAELMTMLVPNPKEEKVGGGI